MFQSVLERRVGEVAEAAAIVARALDPDDVPASEAVRLYRSLDTAVRSLTAAKTLLARRVEDSAEWKRQGYKSAAEFLASTSGTSLGAARSEMETSKALSGLPATKEQMAAGTISPQQGSVIAGAAKANPAAENQLLRTAGTANLHELRDEALKAKAAADANPEATHARLHRERRLMRFTDAAGARHLNLHGPVDEVAVIEAEIDRRLSQVIRERPGDGMECRDALAFDAAVAMAKRSESADVPADRASRKAKQGRPQHLALLRLDVEALWRGYAKGDELVEVTGLGPIPVAAARRLLGDAVLKLIITKGEAVAHVTSLTRGPTQAMRYALLWTSPTCTVEGCSRTIVEHDHRYGAEYKDTRHTRLDELDPLCHSHHDLHTLHGRALVFGEGRRPMVPPSDERHPGNQRAPSGAGRQSTGPPETSSPTAAGRHSQRGLFGDPAA